MRGPKGCTGRGKSFKQSASGVSSEATSIWCPRAVLIRPSCFTPSIGPPPAGSTDAIAWRILTAGAAPPNARNLVAEGREKAQPKRLDPTTPVPTYLRKPIARRVGIELYTFQFLAKTNIPRRAPIALPAAIQTSQKTKVERVAIARERYGSK